MDLLPPLAHPNCEGLDDSLVPPYSASATQHKICDRIEAPSAYSVFTPSLPCTRVTPIDCFAEGNFDAGDYETLLAAFDVPGEKTLLHCFLLLVISSVDLHVGSSIQLPADLTEFRTNFGLYRYHLHCGANPQIDVESCAQVRHE